MLFSLACWSSSWRNSSAIQTRLPTVTQKCLGWLRSPPWPKQGQSRRSRLPAPQARVFAWFSLKCLQHHTPQRHHCCSSCTHVCTVYTLSCVSTQSIHIYIYISDVYMCACRYVGLSLRMGHSCGDVSSHGCSVKTRCVRRTPWHPSLRPHHPDIKACITSP